MEHIVQFYETDASFLEAVSGFIGTGLRRGEGCIVLATSARLKRLEDYLEASGLDLAFARTQGSYLSRDVLELLPQFMLGGSPEPERFAAVVGSLIRSAAAGGRRVRIFGEIVAELWAQEMKPAAIRLEELWNELRPSMPPFLLLCAYPIAAFAGEESGEPFRAICQQHTHVLPDESYTALSSPQERLHVLTVLQQRARALEAEIERRKAVEEALRASEERFRTIVRFSHEAIMLVEPVQDKILEVNPKACSLLGYEHAELLSLSMSAILAEELPGWQSFALSVLKEGEGWTDALSYPSKSGSKIPVEISASRVKLNEHTCILAIMRDIGERKELERQKEALMSIIAHELKTPLTALQGNLQLAQRRLRRLESVVEPGPGESRKLVEDALALLSRGQHLLRMQNRLINDLLDIARLQQHALELRLAPCDLLGLVAEIVQDYQDAHPHRLITLDLPEQESLLVEMDRDRIGQVLGNYLTNALKYSPPDQPVHVGLAAEEATAYLWVQDHGPGIAQEAQQRIWQRFYQAPAIQCQYGSGLGLGLGLYICQQLIGRHHGQVGVESRPGQGARFWFRLPLPRPGA
jgi:PAS domain S-box-containing protein